eukprot:SAG11_NODE_668_length_7841_cov_10.134461_5_plen_280_part_00
MNTAHCVRGRRGGRAHRVASEDAGLRLCEEGKRELGLDRLRRLVHDQYPHRRHVLDREGASDAARAEDDVGTAVARRYGLSACHGQYQHRRSAPPPVRTCPAIPSPPLSRPRRPAASARARRRPHALRPPRAGEQRRRTTRPPNRPRPAARRAVAPAAAGRAMAAAAPMRGAPPRCAAVPRAARPPARRHRRGCAGAAAAPPAALPAPNRRTAEQHGPPLTRPTPTDGCEGRLRPSERPHPQSHAAAPICPRQSRRRSTRAPSAGRRAAPAAAARRGTP